MERRQRNFTETDRNKKCVHRTWIIPHKHTLKLDIDLTVEILKFVASNTQECKFIWQVFNHSIILLKSVGAINFRGTNQHWCNLLQWLYCSVVPDRVLRCFYIVHSHSIHHKKPEFPNIIHVIFFSCPICISQWFDDPGW